MALLHLVVWAAIALVSIIARARAGRLESLWDDVIASALATAALTYVYYL